MYNIAKVSLIVWIKVPSSIVIIICWKIERNTISLHYLLTLEFGA